MEPKFAFQVPNARRVIPIIDGDAARTPMSLSVAKREGYTVLAWPAEDPAGPIAAVDLPDYIPKRPDPAVAARAARLEALTQSAEAEGVAPEVVADFADGNLSIVEARAFMRGLSETAIQSQFTRYRRPHTSTRQSKLQRMKP